jgi:hypothetical protein
MFEVGGGRLEEVAGVAGSIHINSPLIFLFHVSYFIFSYFKNISGINNVGSLSKMFDRTARCIKRMMDLLRG